MPLPAVAAVRVAGFAQVFEVLRQVAHDPAHWVDGTVGFEILVA